MNNVIVPETPLLEGALRLAEQGLAVFPLRVRAKTPATAHGLLDASTDLDQVRRWWTANPWGNIGLRTGGGLVVIDVDPRHGGEVDPAWPKTMSVRTPGGGWHFYYFSLEAVPSSADGRIAPGVDVRGEGGYVVAPPSKTFKGAWEWTDDTAAAMTHADRAPAFVSAGDLLSGAWDAGAPAMLPDDLAHAARTRPDRGARDGAVDGDHRVFVPRDRVGSGERNDYLARAAGSFYGQGFDHDDVGVLLAEENKAVCCPPLDEDEVDRIAASIGRYHR